MKNLLKFVKNQYLFILFLLFSFSVCMTIFKSVTRVVSSSEGIEIEVTEGCIEYEGKQICSGQVWEFTLGVDDPFKSPVVYYDSVISVKDEYVLYERYVDKELTILDYKRDSMHAMFFLVGSKLIKE